jgi:hypothetical protein
MGPMLLDKHKALGVCDMVERWVVMTGIHRERVGVGNY